MSREFRLILGMLCVFLFFILAPILILYSMGYRYSLFDKKIIQYGALIIESKPQEAQILVDGIQQEKQIEIGLEGIKKIVRIQEAKPKEYEIEVKMPNYHSWRKKIKVNPGVITKIPNIVLLPLEPNPKKISQSQFSSQNFVISPDEKKITYFGESPILLENQSPPREPKNEAESSKNIMQLRLIETSKNLDKEIVNISDLVSLVNFHPSEIKWSLDSKKILFSISQDVSLDEKENGSENNIVWFYVNLENGETIDLKKRLPNKIQNLSFLTQQGEKLIYTQNNNLYLIDISQTKNYPKLLSRNISAYTISPNQFFFATAPANYLYKITISDLLAANNIQSATKLSFVPLAENKTIRKLIVNHDNILILTQEDELYYFDVNLDISNLNRKSLLIAKGVIDVKFSPDDKKFAYFTGREVFVSWLYDKVDTYLKTKATKDLITRTAGNIENIFWYDNEHLFLTTQDFIKFSELDDRGERNIFNFFAKQKNSQISWSLLENSLYLIDQIGDKKNIYQIKLPNDS